MRREQHLLVGGVKVKRVFHAAEGHLREQSAERHRNTAGGDVCQSLSVVRFDRLFLHVEGPVNITT